MAERTSSMGNKTALAKYLRQEALTGSDTEIALAHEINRQSVVKQIIIHVFFMSKFGLINPPLGVGEAKSQYIRSTGDNQAAHNAPGQILFGVTPIQQLLTASDDLQLTVENLFGKTDDMHARFNKADSRAEEHGLRTALLDACNFIANVAKTSRFNRAYQASAHFASAFDIYRAGGIAAFRNAALRQQAMIKPNDQADVQKREERIAILDAYRGVLANAESTYETVLGLDPEEIWREYAAIR